MPTLFVNHRVILTPVEGNDPAAVELVRAMWASTGAEVVDMAVDEHDAVLAATSHLPHVLAYALVDALAQSPASDGYFPLCRRRLSGFHPHRLQRPGHVARYRHCQPGGPAGVDRPVQRAPGSLRQAVEGEDGEELFSDLHPRQAGPG